MALTEAFVHGEDIHTRTDAEVFGVPPLMVTPEARRNAKAVNFGIVYGQTPFGLAQVLGIDESSREVHPRVLRKILGRAPLAGRDHCRRAADRRFDQPVRPPPSDSRHEQPMLAASPSGRRSTRRCKALRPT